MPTMTNLLRLFRDILSKPRDNNDRDTALHDNLSKVENSSQDRTFTHGYARASVSIDLLEELREEINRLKKIEKKLASEYGMSSDPIDLPPKLHAPLLPIQSLHVDASRFWAVIIGIDGYPSHNKLLGCVSDAIKMGTFLYEDLGSKTYHPSRANILMTLFGLIDNPEIQKDENIIIYFAGHGAAYRAEGIDVRYAIADISDRQINTILTQISRAKGRRITLILDCCHAGSITRAPPGGRDNAELMSKHFPEWFPDMDSHVALAACEAFQIAIEVKGQGKETGGYFTTHLLAALRSGCLTRETTYRGLLEFIPVSDRQTPVVAGTQMDALL
ncbi:caspase domain-containing protein, partial [Desarmillaria tabescens]